MLLTKSLIFAILCMLCINSVGESKRMCQKCRRQYSNSANFCIGDGTRLNGTDNKTVIKHMPKRPFAIIPGKHIGDWRNNTKDHAKMMWIPSGEFLMGSSDAQIAKVRSGSMNFEPEWYENEKPQHKVYLKGFWIYMTEVTVAQYRVFCIKTGRLMPKAPDWGWIENHPMVNITWYDANDYAKWAKASLPTEAQWEKAARGNYGRTWPWGNKWDASKCSELSKEPERTQPVGSHLPATSTYGCVDMAGSVWEWCADWYTNDFYTSSPARNPTGPLNGNARVLRGGSWFNNSDCFRSAFRYYLPPTKRVRDTGFRCVRTP